MDLDEMYPAPLLPDLVPKTEAELRAETEPLIGEALDMERMFLMDRMERLAYIQGWKQVLDEANREETIRRLAEERGIAECINTL